MTHRRRTQAALVSAALVAALVLVASAPMAAAKAAKAAKARDTGVDVLVVDTGVRKHTEEAARLRTMVQILAPGAEVRILHYRQLSEARLKSIGPRAVILAPTREPWSRYPAKDLRRAEDAIKSWRRPLLGIGGGHQLLARAWGAEVRDMEDEAGEFGAIQVRVVREDSLFEGLPLELEVMTGHREEVAALPESFVQLAEGDRCRIQAMRHSSRPIYGVQFRPEDPRGARLPVKRILRSFLVLAHVTRAEK